MTDETSVQVWLTFIGGHFYGMSLWLCRLRWMKCCIADSLIPEPTMAGWCHPPGSFCGWFWSCFYLLYVTELRISLEFPFITSLKGLQNIFLIPQNVFFAWLLLSQTLPIWMIMNRKIINHAGKIKGHALYSKLPHSQQGFPFYSVARVFIRFKSYC